jgi:hypothetical protein
MGIPRINAGLRIPISDPYATREVNRATTKAMARTYELLDPKSKRRAIPVVRLTTLLKTAAPTRNVNLKGHCQRSAPMVS